MTTGRRAAVTLEGLPLCGLAAADGGTTALEWTPEALRTGEDAGANLVVRQAPAVAGVHRVGARRRFGLPGFLADSLPDAWGRLLVDRAARRAGLDPARLEGLERLLIVGDGGPGALAFAPATVFSGEVGAATPPSTGDSTPSRRRRGACSKGTTTTCSMRWPGTAAVRGGRARRSGSPWARTVRSGAAPGPSPPTRRGISSSSARRRSIHPTSPSSNSPTPAQPGRPPASVRLPAGGAVGRIAGTGWRLAPRPRLRSHVFGGARWRTHLARRR